MPATIKHLRSMNGFGVLADRDGQPPHVLFRRYNLIYGFNGSGKSTLCRIFSSLQSGARDSLLPPTSRFEVELDDGSTLAYPDNLDGLQRRVLVFNADFVERNLQWSNAHANSVFYIGNEQATFAEDLSRSREQHSTAAARQAAAARAVASAEKVLQNFRRDRARLIADRLGLRSRQYEAPQLGNDYAQIEFDGATLDEATLDSYTATCRLDSPPAQVHPADLKLDQAAKTLYLARGVCGIAPSTEVLTELQSHPEMLVWVTEGHKYHEAHSLTECLFCSNAISPERMQTIKNAIEGGIDRVLFAIDRQRGSLEALESLIDGFKLPHPSTLGPAHVKAFEAELVCLNSELNVLRRAVAVAADLLEQKKLAPSIIPDMAEIPTERQAERQVEAIIQAQARLNSVIEAHNRDVADFSELQEAARLAVRKHFLAEGAAEYAELQDALEIANAESRVVGGALEELEGRIRQLESRIREHDPAAEVINKLLHSYLGHSELSISAVNDGYEIRRHGRLISGFPSEGEKTAIALCYFLSTLESEGRKTRNLIVVVDDPVSSLDSRSLNFACNLIKSRLNEAAQLFVLTHNLNCVNEFRKPWKSRAKSGDGREPTATLLFLDVLLPAGTGRRVTNIVELPPLLREYDSEYHYLFQHVLRFVEAGGTYDYAYMMPNVLRRVLEVFLAFRCPGSAGLTGKIDQLCKVHPDLDKDRMGALERLTQVESHSDNLDDLVSFSSMTLEETKDAAAALLVVMTAVDKAHIDGLRRICA